jgi:glycosyltransferase involved in cell wall biosynthesis
MFDTVSIVIPAYNAASWIAEAIESALSQTEPALEILVVDDGSRDGTFEVAQRYGDRIGIVRTEHRGVAAARNLAADLIRGDAFLNLDADDRLVPHAVARLRSAARQAAASDERVAFAYPQYRMLGGAERCSRFPPFTPSLLKERNYIVMSSLIRADVVRRYRFDPAFTEGLSDYDFFLTLAEAGWRGVRVDEPLLEYRQHPDSITAQVKRVAAHPRLMRRLIRKHGDFYTPEDRRRAMARARNTVLVALIERRSPEAPLGRRWLDTLYFARTSIRHAEFQRQLRYLVAPRRVATERAEPGRTPPSAEAS